jgi:hypothetical protein
MRVSGIHVDHATHNRRAGVTHGAAVGFDPLFVSKSRAVSYPHKTVPPRVEMARRRPSVVPENLACIVIVEVTDCRL